MTQNWSNWCWKVALASAMCMGEAIPFGIAPLHACSGDFALAQNITPDRTLTHNSRVTSSGNTNVIEGGTQVGSNLFHSFRRFSLPTGNTAYFNNGSEIENIISRVTGRSASEIDGQIKANGTANLFFINPNGIVFGPHASLDIGGSFVASTASAVTFANGSLFSAIAGQTTPLLTISVPIGLQYGNRAGSIQVQPGSSLSVPDGKTLALVGGNLSLDGASLLVPGGRVELGGVAGTGTVGLFVDGNNVSLSFPDAVARADVSLGNGTEVNVRAAGGGNIAINAQNFNMAGASTLRAGIASGMGSPDSKAGNIEINAIGAITLTDTKTFISNKVLDNATGKGGDIYITAGSLTVANGAQIFAGTSGHGNGGSVTINVQGYTSFDGEGTDSISSGAYSVVDRGVGNGGNVTITTGSLSLTHGAALQANTNGTGDAGNVNIFARDTVSLDGEGADFFSSGAYSRVESSGVGNGGNVNVTTGSLSLTNGAVLSTSIRGQGKAGNVNIFARDTVSFDGQASLPGGGKQSSGAFSALLKTGKGQAGDIYVTTGSLFLTNGATLLTSTEGQGNAGNVIVNARDTVSFDGEGANFSSSGAYSRVESSGVGNGGTVKVTTGSLSVTNGAVFTTSTSGQGDAGSVVINARDRVSFDGEGADFFSSGAYSAARVGAVGNGGSINVTTGSLSVTNGATLLTSTEGQGNAGNVIVNARDTVSFDGEGADFFSSGAYSRVESSGVGNGGTVKVTTGSLSVTNGAVFTTSTLGQGDAGSVVINARDRVSFDGEGSFDGQLRRSSGAYSAARAGAVGNGGSINVTTGSLSVTNGATLFTSTEGQGNAGNILVNAANFVTLSGVGSDGFSSGLYGTAETGAIGQGGSIKITTGQLKVLNGGQVTVSSTGSGKAGNLEATASSILLDNNAILSADTTAGQGNINLRSGDLILRHGSNITTNAQGRATGGNITINTDNLVAIPRENSDISAKAEESFGGRVIINAQGIFGTQFQPQDTPFSDITATSALGPQFSGIVQINTLGIDPTRGLSNLPTVPVDASRQIAQNCRVGAATSQQSSFVVTGHGGLPANPKEALSSDAVQVDWVSLNRARENHSRPDVSQKATTATTAPLVEAQGWVLNPQGQVVLTATAPTVTPHSSWQKPTDCRAPQMAPRS